MDVLGQGRHRTSTNATGTSNRSTQSARQRPPCVAATGVAGHARHGHTRTGDARAERKGQAPDVRPAAKAGGTPQRCEKGLDAARAAMPGRLRFAGSAGWQLAGNGAKRHEKSHATTGGHGTRRACRDRQPNNRPCAGYWALRVNQGRYWHATLPPPRRRSVRFRAQRPTEARTARHAVKPVTEQQQPAVAPPRHPRQPQRAAARARGA